MTSTGVIEAQAIELIYEDGIPMDSPWHRSQMNLLIDLTHQHWQGRTDYYTGGNMFVYFSFEQARNRDYRGPDYFTVLGVDGTRGRKAWVVWEEGGRYPDVIVELLSDSTREEDLGRKKDLYERVFRTPEYFCYDGERQELLGWRLTTGRYQAIAPARGPRHPKWMWSAVLQANLGLWVGEFQKQRATWLRLFDEADRLIPTPAEAERERAEAEHERAEAEHERAEAERERAEAAEEAAVIVRVAYRQELAAARARLAGLTAARRDQVLAALARIDSELERQLGGD